MNFFYKLIRTKKISLLMENNNAWTITSLHKTANIKFMVEGRSWWGVCHWCCGGLKVRNQTSRDRNPPVRIQWWDLPLKRVNDGDMRGRSIYRPSLTHNHHWWLLATLGVTFGAYERDQVGWSQSSTWLAITSDYQEMLLNIAFEGYLVLPGLRHWLTA